MRYINGKQIRVMHVIESLDFGGAENVMAEIIRHMPAYVTTTICCIKKSGVVADRLDGYVDQIYELNNGDGNTLRIPLKIAELVKKERIDIIHAHNWNTFCESIISSMISQKPVIHTIHGHHFTYPATARGIIKKKIRHVFEKILSIKSSKICPVSEAIADYIVHDIGISRRHLSVCINGVDAGTVLNKNVLSRELLGATDDDFLVCFTGRLMPVKNIENLLSALELVLKDYKKIKLMIVGDGPDRKFLEKIVIEKKLDEAVIFLGYRNDVRAILANADIFVLPSLYEGISISLLEAMASGLPVIASDVGGNREILSDNETGFLYTSGDYIQLSNHIKSLYKSSELRKHIGKSAREKVTQFFSINKTTVKYLKYYINYIKK